MWTLVDAVVLVTLPVTYHYLEGVTSVDPGRYDADHRCRCPLSAVGRLRHPTRTPEAAITRRVHPATGVPVRRLRLRFALFALPALAGAWLLDLANPFDVKYDRDDEVLPQHDGGWAQRRSTVVCA